MSVCEGKFSCSWKRGWRGDMSKGSVGMCGGIWDGRENLETGINIEGGVG